MNRISIRMALNSVQRACAVFGSSIAVYLVMTACAATPASVDEAGPVTGQPPPASSADDGTVGQILGDALDPVPEASAAPGAPDVAEESCDKPSGSLRTAVHKYPGKTRNELARVVALCAVPTTQTIAPEGIVYQHITQPAYVVDGAVASICSSPGGTTCKSITFILPQ